MENLKTTEVLTLYEAERRAYSLNISNGHTCSITDGNAKTRHFRMEKGILIFITDPSWNYYEEQLDSIRFYDDGSLVPQPTNIKVMDYNGHTTNWLTLNKESATDLVKWLTKNFIK